MGWANCTGIYAAEKLYSAWKTFSYLCMSFLLSDYLWNSHLVPRVAEPTKLACLVEASNFNDYQKNTNTDFFALSSWAWDTAILAFIKLNVS